MLTIRLPADVEQAMRDAWGDTLDRAALEALVIEGYRSRKFGISQVGRILGFDSRWEAEEWLGRRGVPWNYSVDDLAADCATLDRVLARNN
jgi:predicted HTH domain antitoxin